MSNYIQSTKNPATKQFEEAEWIDRGNDRWEVKFPSTGNTYNPDDFGLWPPEPEPEAVSMSPSQIKKVFRTMDDPFDPCRTFIRTGEGHCPVCNRYFGNVVLHQNAKHGLNIIGKFSNKKKKAV